MSLPKVLFKKCWWMSEGSQADAIQEPSASPVFTDAHLLGTILTLSEAKEYQEALFETPVYNGGSGERQRWVHRDVINQSDEGVLTVVCAELTPLFFEMMAATHGPYATQGSNSVFTSGINPTRKGWFRYEATDDAGVAFYAAQTWGKLDLPSWDLPQTGYVQVTFNVRRLYSTKNQGGFRNF
jgi:hypothetical protein